ncbi:MAG: hypothetical protein ACRCSN_05320 [Dermatophilaceae bacterium]
MNPLNRPVATPTVRELIVALADTEDALRECEPAGTDDLTDALTDAARQRAALERQGRILAELRLRTPA